MTENRKSSSDSALVNFRSISRFHSGECLCGEGHGSLQEVSDGKVSTLEMKDRSERCRESEETSRRIHPSREVIPMEVIPTEGLGH